MEPVEIVTRQTLAARADAVWHALLFYEQIEQRPPLLLRLLLPLPVGTQGAKARVGDEALCVYESGQLLKRVTRIEAGRHYGFEVTEQRLRVGTGVRLQGGSYTLRELADGRTEVALTTRYVNGGSPGWLFRPVEAWVCHRFHRHLLAAIGRKAVAGQEMSD